SLPAEMTTPPSYRKLNPADAPVLLLVLSSPSLNLSELNDYAENLISPSLSTVDGVAQVGIYGQKRFAVRVRVRPDPLSERHPTANTVEVVDRVRAMLPRFEAQMPASIALIPFNDRSVSIRAALHDVNFTLALTVVLVVLVIFLFLRRLSATIIPALSLPVS